MRLRNSRPKPKTKLETGATPVLRHGFDLALGHAEWSGISEVPGIHQALALTKFCFVSSSQKQCQTTKMRLAHYSVTSYAYLDYFNICISIIWVGSGR
jgi:hypothetical protein